MDIERGRVYLNKINRLYDSLSESKTSISAIEKKLMLDYISNLYDAMLDDAPPVQPRAKVYEQPRRSQPAYTPPKREEVKRPVYVPKQEPVKVEKPQPVEEAPRPILKYEFPKPEPKKPVVFEPPKPVQPARPAPRFNSEYDELFELEKSNELSDRLSTVPISNIKMAMGINERFLTINELFKGKSGVFDKVVEKLNGLKSFEEARMYLEQEMVKDYEWASEGKLKKAKRFVKLVHRLYLR